MSDRTSSLPGVLAGCGTAGECLSEDGDAAAAAAAPDAAGASLARSSTDEGEACGWDCEGLAATGWGRASETGWASDCECLAAAGLAASPMAGGVAAAGELGELELPPSCRHERRAFKVTKRWFGRKGFTRCIILNLYFSQLVEKKEKLN